MKKLIVITRPDFFPGEGEMICCLFQEGMERLHLRKPGSDEASFVALLKEIPETDYPRIVLHDHFELLSRENNLSLLGGIHLNRRNPKAPEGYQGDLSRSCHSFEEVEQCLQIRHLLTLPQTEFDHVMLQNPSHPKEPANTRNQPPIFSQTSHSETNPPHTGLREPTGRLSLISMKNANFYQYVFLSPLFPSISKEGYGSGFSLTALRDAARQGIIGERVVALGGLSVETLPQIKDFPFGGAAVLGSLWGIQPGLEPPHKIIKRYKQLQTCLV